MPIRFTYQPPPIDAGIAVHAALTAAETAAAQHILDKSKDLVPVDTGQLRDSGHVEHDAGGAAMVYDATSPEGFPYGIKVHEDLTASHPNGGQAKFLQVPMNQEAQAAAAIMAAEIRKVLG